MNVLNRPAIKKEASAFIKADNKWLKMFLPCLIIYLLSGNLSSLLELNDYFHVFDSNVVSIIQMAFNGAFVISIFLFPFAIAIGGYYLNFIRGFNPACGSLYSEGAHNYGKYFVTQLLSDIYIILWTLLFIVPGIIKSYSYSQIRYIIHDNPNLTASQAIQMSKIMTKDFKSDLFIMHLSFFFWYMLSGLTFGLALFYVIPYVETTNAMFYENLKRFSIDSKRISPEAFGMMPVDADNSFNNSPENPEEAF
ncbi:MAG: DUF975 family protein [Oscillospiraceae bacterium]